MIDAIVGCLKDLRSSLGANQDGAQDLADLLAAAEAVCK